MLEMVVQPDWPVLVDRVEVMVRLVLPVLLLFNTYEVSLVIHLEELTHQCIGILIHLVLLLEMV